MPHRFLFRFLNVSVPIGDPVPDIELLRRFTQDRDSAALELLVRRHSSAVWSACRRVLTCEADAEDAFQATFLVLARKAGAIRGSCVGGWLHRVAVNTALKLRERSARFVVASTERLADFPALTPGEHDWELQSIVQEELARLPERYRLPVVLCELEGHSHAEVAKLLGWPIGSVSGRLSRARTILQNRLTRRGVATPAIMFPVLILPPAIVSNTAAAATGSTAISPTVSKLSEGVLSMMHLARCRAIAVWLLSIGLVTLSGFGTLIALGQGPRVDSQANPTQPAEPPSGEKAQSGGKKVDPKEDAVARELKALQGEWKVVGLESDGRKASPKEMEGMRWIIKNNQIEGKDPGEELGKIGDFKIDPRKDPKHFDIEGFAGEKKKSTLGIYKLENGRLTICLRDAKAVEKGRPTEFSSDDGEEQGLIILESVANPPKPVPAVKDAADLMMGKRWVVKDNDTLELNGPAGKEGSSVKLPRLRLEPGQEFIYSGVMEMGNEGAGYKTFLRGEWRYWVVRTNKDGSWSIVMRSSAIVQGNKRLTCMRCDMFPDGRTVEISNSESWLSPRLPSSASEAAKGWVSKVEREGRTYRYRLVPAAKDGRCSIEEVRESSLDTACGVAMKTIYTWDTERVFPETIRFAVTNPDERSERGTLKLREVKIHDLAWSQKLTADAERYFAAEEAYNRTFTGLKLNGSSTEIKAALDKAKLDLKAALQTLEVPEFREQVDEMLASHDQKVKYYVEESERRKTILGQQAADWSTTDLQGKSHALKDYRGKVVILDFWYRSCLFCVQAMPQMKEIATQFKDQPVVVLGMNTDDKEADAQQVVEKMGLNFPTLKATGLPEKYKVQSFPTLVIIDQQGIVRDIHLGFSATLKDEVVKSVEELLKKDKR